MKQTIIDTMKRLVVVSVSFIAVFSAAFADDVSLSANATLKDGSVVKGEFLTKAINGSTLFSKTLALDSWNVRSLAFSNTNGEAKVELANGDKFAIKVTDPTLTIKSLRVIKFFIWRNPVMAEGVYRQCFFAWLWRHAKWRW